MIVAGSDRALEGSRARCSVHDAALEMREEARITALAADVKIGLFQSATGIHLVHAGGNGAVPRRVSSF
jgi:hypothetical protein